MRFEFTALLSNPCPNLWHDLLAAGRLDGAFVEVPDGIARQILARCEQPPQIVPSTPEPSLAIPEPQWPIWARALLLRRRRGEAGVGDTLERLIAPLGAKRVALTYERLAGKPCGCQDRKQWLSRKYPYSGV